MAQPASPHPQLTEEQRGRNADYRAYAILALIVGLAGGYYAHKLDVAWHFNLGTACLYIPALGAICAGAFLAASLGESPDAWAGDSEDDLP